MTSVLSSDAEVFSTPPTSPMPKEELPPSFSRRNSRPSTLQIDQSHPDWSPDIVLEEQSLDSARMHGNGHANDERSSLPPVRPVISPPSSAAMSSQFQSMHSPCFVHSHLDKGASLADWLRMKQHQANGNDDVSKLRHQPIVDQKDQVAGVRYPDSTSLDKSVVAAVVDEEEEGSSLTRQLAETAVGVREMSKQLGRTRVRSTIQTVLVVTKARDNRLIELTRELALYLMTKKRFGDRGLVVYVDNQLRHSRRFDADGIERDHPELFTPFPRRRSSSNNSLSSMSSNSTNRADFYVKEQGQLRYWTSDMCSRSPHLFDFVVTLGGDGTVLFTSWLFQRIVPPVLPFALGSLGFLTNFDFVDHRTVMDSAIDAGIRVNLRMRFTCTVYRAVAAENGKWRKAVKKGETGEIMMKNVEKGGWEALEGGWSGSHNTHESGKANSKDKEIMCFTTRPLETFEVLNDLVVDRGPSPYVSLLELFGDEHHMTTVQADGLTVSTPTGSTAYSLSAGGSLVHPEIPALLITPICPHTLSFRPMLLPDSMELRICVPFNSRSTAWASFDGRGRVELKQGDHIKVTASKYPFPTVCADNQSIDWFHSISRTLKWNERERQKSFVVVEEGPAKRTATKPSKLAHSTVPNNTIRQPRRSPDSVDEAVEDDENSEEEEISEDEDDKFDIDDSSPEAAAPVRAIMNHQTPEEEALGMAKAREQEGADPCATPEAAALALHDGNAFMRSVKSRAKSRSRSRSRFRSHSHSGVDTPGRFAGPTPHPPRITARHIEFADPTPLSPSTSSDSLEPAHPAQQGARDDINTRKSGHSSGKSRIPRDRDIDGESMSMKTPTVADVMHGGKRVHLRAHSPEQQHHHRAFAVWGQDESDSNASDSDV